jgi:hypothetical protein
MEKTLISMEDSRDLAWGDDFPLALDVDPAQTMRLRHGWCAQFKRRNTQITNHG